jgi:hypothetical protein
VKFNFVGPTYQSESPNVDAQRTVNLYPEFVESGTGKAKVVLYGTPGLATFCTLPTSPIRGMFAGDNRLFVAAGTKLYEVFANGTYTEMGTIANDASNSPVQMWPNGDQLFVVSAGYAYYHDGSALNAAPVPADDTIPSGQPGGQVGTASTGTFLDGYFIASKYSSKRFFISDLSEGAATWDASDYGTKEGYPDAINRILSYQSELWLFGDQTTEVWINDGNADFPFRRQPGAFIHEGCVATFSPVGLGTNIGWLGGDATGRTVAWIAQGYQPQRVSTHAVEQAWAAYATVADAISWTYTDRGHIFWVLTFPTAAATWAYDLVTKMWHERASLTGGTLGQYRARCNAYVFGRQLVGAYDSGKLYSLLPTTYTDDGQPIRRIRTAPHIAEEQLRAFYHRLQLDLEVGLTNGATVSLDWSDDGGHTFNTPISKSLGSTGSYKQRVIWNRLGSSRDRVFRVTTDAQQRVALIDAYLQVTGGNA